MKKKLFKRNPKKIAEKILQTHSTFCQEEQDLLDELKKSGKKEVMVLAPSRFSTYPGMVFTSGKLPSTIEIGHQLGISAKEILDLNKKVNLEISKFKLRNSSRDKILVQSINALDELEEVINLMMEHLRELYSLHFPELAEMVKEPKEYLEVIIEKKKESKLKKAKKESIGMEFSLEDKKVVVELAKGILSLYSSKDSLKTYLEKTAKEIAPNTTALVGSLLSSRLISLAGSLEKLALMPSSTIQILGAEKAFFRFLKNKKKPPKHGIIFQLPEIRSAKKKARGKLARTLAGKIAIAAKTDFYGGKFIGDKLRKEFLERVKRVKKK